MASSDVPVVVWVRHQDQLHWLHVCVYTWPYSSVALNRFTQQQRGELPDDPMTIICMIRGPFTVSGSGLSRDEPMFCDEMETRPLPVCRCEYLPDVIAALQAKDPHRTAPRVIDVHLPAPDEPDGR